MRLVASAEDLHAQGDPSAVVGDGDGGGSADDPMNCDGRGRERGGGGRGGRGREEGGGGEGEGKREEGGRRRELYN